MKEYWMKDLCTWMWIWRVDQQIILITYIISLEYKHRFWHSDNFPNTSRRSIHLLTIRNLLLALIVQWYKEYLSIWEIYSVWHRGPTIICSLSASVIEPEQPELAGVPLPTPNLKMVHPLNLDKYKVLPVTHRPVIPEKHSALPWR